MAKVKNPNFEEINKNKPPLVYKERKFGGGNFTHNVRHQGILRRKKKPKK